MDCCVYGVVVDANIIYVGATRNLPNRATKHRETFGKDIRLVVLQRVDEPSMLKTAENYWIATGALMGWPLTNIQGVVRPSEVLGITYTAQDEVESIVLPIKPIVTQALREKPGDLDSRIIEMLQELGEARTERIYSYFHNDVIASDLKKAMSKLMQEGLVQVRKEATKGRAAVIYSLIPKDS